MPRSDGRRIYEASTRRHIAAPRHLLWGLVADTNRWDRAAGLAAGTYRFREIEGRWQKVATAKQLGFELAWVEPPYEWVEGRFVDGERRFLEGPSHAGGLHVDLEARPDGGTEVHARFFVEPSGATAPLVGRVMRRRFRQALERYLDSVEAALGEAPAGIEDDPSEPSVQLARRALGTAAARPSASRPKAGRSGELKDTQRAGESEPERALVTGGRTPPDESVLFQRADRLYRAPVERTAADSLVRHLRVASDDEVLQMRPFELARVWGVDRREALRAFLHATVAGLVDLQWQVNCPVCRVAAGFATSLGEVDARIHCEACRIDYDVGFGDHVEAVFNSNAAIRAVEPAVYCAASPAFRPHVLAQLACAARQARQEEADLPAERYLVRCLDGSERARVTVPPGHDTLRITLEDGRIGVESDTTGSGIVIDNGRDTDAMVLVERTGWSADAVLGSTLASFSDFLGLFATEAPAAGVELTVSSLSVLFTDLSGSTAIYQELGDARAFRLVQDHFREVEAISARHGGALVKTMGDAIMSTFEHPARAVAAALDMLEAHGKAHPPPRTPDDRDRPQAGRLGLKVGVHAGPCLVVRANDRLDFFGTTVNEAARLQAEARSGELVITESLAQDAEVATLVRDRSARQFETDLKGLEGRRRLISVQSLAQGGDRAPPNAG